MRFRYIDEDGKLTHNVRLLKSTVEQQDLSEAYKLDELADAIVKGDPEVDIERFGRYLTETSRVYTSNRKIVFHVREEEINMSPDGEEKSRADREVKFQNTNTDLPIRWSNKMIDKDKAIRKVCFYGTPNRSCTPTDLRGIFLFEIAEELDKKNALMFVGGGKKGTDPLIFQRGGKQYRGFLEGRIEGESYCLLLHLSNLELKRPRMNIKFDKKKFKKKVGDYHIGPATALEDLTLHARAQEYKRRLSALMTPLEPARIKDKIPNLDGYLVTRKVDGEFCLLFL